MKFDMNSRQAEKLAAIFFVFPRFRLRPSGEEIRQLNAKAFI